MYNFEMNKLSQIAFAWELYKNNTPIVTISKTLGVHRETIGIWILKIKNNSFGITGFINEYINAKKGERKKRKVDKQAFIESFNRTLRKEYLGWSKYSKSELPILEKELNQYLVYYHEKRTHLSLNMMTPNEFIKNYQLIGYLMEKIAEFFLFPN
jgi:hypothetical protein